ncbi:MAG: Gx transporter family protein [Lachnospiraceae bacterium]|nr:Gx transporter family protein [Lachnospiraceae bacterium]
MKKSSRAAYVGVFAALAIVLSYLESLIPVFVAVPGVKLGLTNAVIVVILYKIGAREAFLVNIVRIAVTGLLFGNPVMFIYSLCGGMVSYAVMFALKKSKLFSVAGVSVAGAVSHNLAQVSLACFLLENGSIAYYMAVLLITGAVSGFMIGLLSVYLIKNVHFK